MGFTAMRTETRRQDKVSVRRIVLGFTAALCLLIPVYASALQDTSPQGPAVENEAEFAEIRVRLSEGRSVFLENRGRPYRINGTLTFARNASLRGAIGTVLISEGDGAAFDVPPSATHVAIENITFRQNGRSRTLGAVRAGNFRLTGGGAVDAGTLVFSNARNGRVERARFENGVAANAIAITNGSSGIAIEGNEFERNAGFGIQIDNGANGNDISNNWTRANGIELVGIRYNAFGNVIAYNRAEGTGDNGISVTGDRNVVLGNRVSGNALNGIAIYGDENTVMGNVALGNGQNLNPRSPLHNPQDTSVYAGILANGAFGGGGRNNVIVGNIIADDQAQPTQLRCVMVGQGYGRWRAATDYTARRFIYADGEIYQTENAGTSGTLAPSGEGVVTDGRIAWTHIRTLAGNGRPSGNMIANNQTSGCDHAPARAETSGQP
ncbi:copper-binding protein NosD [Rhizobium sp. PP-F2F-G38]|uniref:right-handed parallel beta-helix repeat-containing protein n=1 Tax=Rhizobium sp. PP-CC-3G-465 TaxID=2135648 RepID=UPI000D84FBB5|nr:copper-binding protein NosD [Rhizobium sp. PP-WC-1G-195]PYE94839.1 copper-binding protein NosD [Rhizobium sp. PP-F2F-G38]TCQ25981.1 copper-binding protein NosD [Rhizobium sp. PP-CC-3G-465]